MHPLHAISTEQYSIWLGFSVHLCKMMISPGVYFIFAKFRFFGLLGGQKAKNGPKWQKILSVTLHISGPIHKMSFMVHMCKMIISPGGFYIFAKFWFFGLLGGGWGVKKQKVVRNHKKFCPSRSMSQEPYVMWLSFMVRLCKIIMSPDGVFIFSEFWFSGCIGVQEQKTV